ncbi:MAG: PRC-barrel domain protein [bacterium ADurb.Bin400]|nr:MAG: PRC-barrel domain protein [bacterium ADurb.Bin400]
MIIPYTKILGLPVVALKSQSVIGFISDIAIQKEPLGIHGFIIKQSHSPFTKPKAITIHDVVELGNQSLLVLDNQAISELNDTLRLNQALQHGYHGIGQTVVTTSGRRLGKVTDFLISTPTLSINKFYVCSLFKERIIASSAISKINGKTITIKDDYNLIMIEPAIETEVEFA